MAKLQRRPLTRAAEVRTYAHREVEVFDMGDFIGGTHDLKGIDWSRAIYQALPAQALPA